MPRVGLTPPIIAQAASTIVDRDGRSSLTLARVAEQLGVRPPSLYNHVDGLDGLERLVALDGLERLVDECRGALVGRSGPDGLRSMARVYLSFARANPGVYPLTQVARPGDDDYQRRARRLLDDLLALLSGFGIPDDELIHAARAMRSALHGFAMLEVQEGFGLETDVDESFEWLLDSLERSLTR